VAQFSSGTLVPFDTCSMIFHVGEEHVLGVSHALIAKGRAPAIPDFWTPLLMSISFNYNEQIQQKCNISK